MSALDRLPALATTGVGSLPFIAPAPAAQHAVRAYDVPFCPQLPRIDGDMVREWLGADPGRCGWSPDRDRQRPAAWDAFLAQLAVRPPEHRVVKLQVTGPVTLAIALERGGGGIATGRASLALAHEIAHWLGAAAAEQVDRLAALGLDVILIADEPGLAAAGLTSGGVDLWEPLRSAGSAGWGLHVCGAVPWSVIDATDIDVLSFDVGRHGVDSHGRRALRRLVSRGGRIAWGVLDPTAATHADGAAATAAAAIAGVSLPVRDVAERSLLTPACGTGRLGEARERLVASVLTAASDGARAALRAMAAQPCRAASQRGPAGAV
jgi:hypothetical protein